jgi:hypothetical protein
MFPLFFHYCVTLDFLFKYITALAIIDIISKQSPNLCDGLPQEQELLFHLQDSLTYESNAHILQE